MDEQINQTINFYVVPRFKNERSYTSAPSTCLQGVHRDNCTVPFFFFSLYHMHRNETWRCFRPFWQV